jgi:hypothetical protein
MAEESAQVNLPFTIPDLVGPTVVPNTRPRNVSSAPNYDDIFNGLVNQATPKTGRDLPSVYTAGIDMSGRYSKFYPGMDNEELYAQNQGTLDKVFNGVTKMAGIAGSTFINGTVGTVYGLKEFRKTGKFSSFYDNPMSNELNDWTESLENQFANYKTQRERNGNWWEPSNLLTANFFMDNIVKNLGYGLGAAGAGFAFGGALRAIGLTGRLAAMGAKTAAQADAIVAEAAMLPEAERIAATTSKLNGLWQSTKSTVGKGLMSIDRGIVATTGTMGEAGLEALSNSRQFRTTAIADYVSRYGATPQGADLERINEAAESVGNWSFGANAALLSVTNYIQLPKIYSSSFKAEKNIVNGVARAAGEYVDTLPKGGFGKFMYKSKNVGSLFFNTSEAFEEGAQFAIQTGSQNYFNKKSKGQDVNFIDDALKYGIEEALTSDEGLLNVFTGGFSGALQSSGIVGMKNGVPVFGKTGKIGERGLTGYGGEAAVERAKLIDEFNPTTIRKKLVAVNANIAAAEAIQGVRKDAVAVGDQLEAKDAEFDYAHTFIDTRLRYNAKEAIDDEINELREEALVTGGFEKLQQEGLTAPTDDKESFLRRLDGIQKQANDTAKLRESIDLKYKGLINPETKKPIYADDVLDKLVYLSAKMNDYNNRIPQVSNNLTEKGVLGVSDLISEIINTATPGESLPDSVNDILDKAFGDIAKMPIIDTEKDDLKQSLFDVGELALRRKNALLEYNEILTRPQDFSEDTREEEAVEQAKAEVAPSAPKPSVKVKTFDGEEDLEIGTEYFVGVISGKTKADKNVIDFPKFTILEENEDGTLKIKLEDGSIQNIDKSRLSAYKVGKVEDARNNKKALFYINNRNKVYEMNFGKDKKTGESRRKKGRLSYSPKEGILLFNYINDWGKPASIEVKNTNFVAQPGFKQPMIQAVGKLTKEEQKAFDDFINDNTPDPRLLEKVRTIAGTLEVVFDETLQALEDNKKLVESKTDELNKITEQLDKLTGKVEGPQSVTDKTKRFKAATHRTIQAISSLTKLRDGLKEDLAMLNSEQTELEMRLEDILHTSEEFKDFPGNYKEFYDALKQERDNVESAIVETGLQINKLSDLIDLVEDTLEKAYKAAKKLIDKFFDKYPNVPLDRIGIINFLNNNIEANKAEKEEMQRTTSYAEAEKIVPYTAVAGNLLEDIYKLDSDLAQIDEIDVVPNEPIISGLRDELRGLNAKLKEYEQQLSAKEGTLKRLDELYDLHKQELEKMEQEEIEAARNTTQFKEDFIGTADTSVPSVNYESGYEPDPKKTWQDVLSATTAVSKSYLKEGEVLKEHHIRSNKFGINLYKFPNRSRIFGVLVSKGNEAQLDMDGLIDGMGGNDSTIALVMVERNQDGSVTPVGVDGQVIANPEDRIKQGIYQTMPDPKLTNSKGDSMFRDDVPKTTQEYYRELYAKDMADMLANPSLQTYDITPSFGIPEYVTYPDQFNSKGKPKRNYDAKVSVKDSGLITVNDEKDDLIEERLISVPTTSETISKGSTSFSNALGRIFLELSNAYVKLNNSNLTKAQANAIYDAVLRLSIIGKIKNNTEATEIINWLRTVIYWGTPKNRQTGESKPLSYNSLFFDATDEGLMLFISGKGKNIPFTPTSIRANKANIIESLQELYHNVNSARVNGSEWQKGYTEILSISESGKRQERQWPNYQSYLLSSEGRSPEDIPLTTNIKPLEGPDDVNRESVYFSIARNLDRYSQAPAAPAARVLGQTAAAVAETPTQDLEGYVLDGKTPNTIPLFKGAVEISFVADQDNFFDENGNPAIDSFEVTKGQEILQEKFNTPDVITSKVTAHIIKTILPQVDSYLSGKEQPSAEEVITPSVEVFEEPVGTIDDPTIETLDIMDDIDPNDKPATEYRIAIDNYNDERLEREDWPKVESWLKQNFPNIPVYRVKNMIQATNGRQAWGMLQNGALYLTENAITGTAYHEVFEAVWKSMTPLAEQTAILKEMKGRSGEFFDNVSYETVKYSKATDKQLKEKLADEFAEFVQTGKKPAGEGKSFIRQLFDDMIAAIKEFFTGEKAMSNTEKLFSKIGNGYYAQYNAYEGPLTFAKQGFIDIQDIIATGDAQYSLAGFTDIQWNDLMQQMTYLTMSELTVNKRSIFDVTKVNQEVLYNRIKGNISYGIKSAYKKVKDDVASGKKTAEQSAGTLKNYEVLHQNIMNSWDAVVASHKEYVLPYQIDFDDNHNAMLRDENNSGKEDYLESNKIDSFKKANSAIKLFLASLPQVDTNGNVIPSTVAGIRLIPVSQVQSAIRNAVSKSRNPDEMIGNLKKLAENDASYKVLVDRITYSIPNFTLDKMETDHQVQLITALWKTFKKTNPEVKYVYILTNGDVVIDDSNFSEASRQTFIDMEDDLIMSVRDPKNPYFEFSKKDNAYVGKPSGLGTKPNDLPSRIKLLSGIGIKFTQSQVKPQFLTKFNEAVDGIYDSIKAGKKIASLGARTLDISGRLKELSQIKAITTNPEFDATFYNINGELTQSFIGTNVHSDLYDMLSQIDTLDGLQNTTFDYLMNGRDSFAQNSVKINEMFNRKTGRAISGRNPAILKNGYVEGIFNSLKNNRTASSKLNYRNRLVQQLNLMIKGYYMNLVPGDGGLEHVTYMGNSVDINDSYGEQMKTIKDIFRGYFIDEMNVSREERSIVESAGRKNTDLRFLKPILDNFRAGLHDKIVLNPENLSKTPEEVYEAYKDTINEAVEKYLNTRVDSYMSTLSSYELITNKATEQEEVDDMFSIENVAITDLTQEQLRSKLFGLTSNFAINNIEFHKLIYGDPYQYKDELKRVKNFNSPHEAVAYGSNNLNIAFDKVYNKDYKPGDIGHTDFNKDSLASATLEDVIGVIDLKGYKGWEEADGGGMITMKGVRNLRIRASEWNKDNEKQYQYDIAWEKRYKKQPLSEKELALLEEGNPKVQSTYAPRKPIGVGNLGNEKFNNPLLDKFALYPISYRMMKELSDESGDMNIVKLYDRMQESGVDYVVFKSARKVGAKRLHQVYNNEGDFVTESFGTTEDGGIIEVPFAILSNQSEVPTKEESTVTTGSQVTKLMTLDMMDAGVPADFMPTSKFEDRFEAWYNLETEEDMFKASPLYEEIKNNQRLIEAMIENGVDEMMNILGISRKNGTYVITDRSKATDTLRREILKREVNQNVIKSLDGFLRGESIIEATPAFRQIKDILYSIADKNVISRTMTGGQKVQIPSTLLEKVRSKKTTINGKTGYTSDVLKYYNDVDPDTGETIKVAEVMVRRWFDNKTTEKMSDVELLNYLNTTEEGKEILKGIAFRIPTQKQNSIDAFRIAKFLPKEFGDAVVIPSALVAKAGSDFDIDKLSMYFKNVMFDKSGKPKLVPFYGIGESAKAKFAELFNDAQKTDVSYYDELFKQASSDVFFEGELEETLAAAQSATDKKKRFVDSMYKKSLQNAYVTSSQNLVSSDYNYSQLVKPNSADDLKKLTKELSEDLGVPEFDYTATDNMLRPELMARLRYGFLAGKQDIGIAAVGQTNHAQSQRLPFTINPERRNLLSTADKGWIGDAQIKFDLVNRVNGKATLSRVMSADNKQFISDINGMFIDGSADVTKDDWLIRLGATPNVISTYLFLVNVGVPIRDIAYFMKQPIIRDYLRMLEIKGYSYLFIDTYVDELSKSDKYATTGKPVVTSIPEFSKLQSMIKKDVKNLTNDEKAEQQFMLKEFLKYAKMAEQLYYVVQGTNYDTARFNDPFLIFKKSEQLKRAKNTIFDNVQEFIDSSFVGKLSSALDNDVRGSIGQMLISDQGNIGRTLESVLLPFVNINDNDFLKIAQVAVSDLFDWAVQNDSALNNRIEEMLISETGTADKVNKFLKSIKEGHPLYGNYIVDTLVVKPAKRSNQANNLYIKNKVNKVYDQNRTIYAFNELKSYLASQNKSSLYDDLVKLSVLQSGLRNSAISFTSLLPYDDFVKMYGETLSYINEFTNLNSFTDLKVLNRENWNNTDIDPSVRAPWIKTKKGKWMYNPGLYNAKFSFVPKNVIKAVRQGQIPAILQLSTMGAHSNADVISYTWEVGSTKDKKAMRAKGDYSYIKKGLFQKVYDGDSPYISESESNGKVYKSFVYKMINAWGQGVSGNEFYMEGIPSKFDNGYEKVYERVEKVPIVDESNRPLGGTVDIPYSGEVSDDAVLAAYGEVVFDNTADSVNQIEEEVTDTAFDNMVEFSEERKQEIVSNFASKHKMTADQAKAYISEALVKDREKIINKLNECY